MVIYTDGSCTQNPNGPGGFGVIVVDNNEKQIINTHYENSEHTTNNREELKAILWTFLVYGSKDDFNIPIVYSDSAYCVNTFNTWMFNWVNNDWKTNSKKEPENLDLIKSFYSHWENGYRIDLRKCKGHSDNYWNNMVDKLAKGEKLNF